jgi:UDP-N-acetylglucosamine 2-epimerase
MQQDYKRSHPDQCVVVPSLGYVRYLSAMRLCDAVIGNSSSGIFEAPALKKPSINIGDRQKGRIRPESVVDCTPLKASILDALNIIYSDAFTANLETMEVVFEKPGTAEKIKEILQNTDLRYILKKEFFPFR